MTVHRYSLQDPPAVFSEWFAVSGDGEGEDGPLRFTAAKRNFSFQVAFTEELDAVRTDPPPGGGFGAEGTLEELELN